MCLSDKNLTTYHFVSNACHKQTNKEHVVSSSFTWVIFLFILCRSSDHSEEDSFDLFLSVFPVLTARASNHLIYKILIPYIRVYDNYRIFFK